MKSDIKLLLLALVISAGSAPAGGAVLSTVDIRLQGSVESTDVSVPVADRVTERDSYDYFDNSVAQFGAVASLDHSESATVPNGFVYLEASGTAGIGELRASMKGNVEVTSGGINDARVVMAAIPNFTRVLVRVTDVLAIRDPAAPGIRITWVGKWQVSGDFDAGLSFSHSSNVGTGTAISTETRVTTADGVTRQGFVSDSNISGKRETPLPAEILVVVTTRGGVPFNFENALEIRAAAAALHRSGNENTRISGFFENNFSNTLRWGGITSVINTDTGQPILNWTITSESGFDYSRPAPVPEPASVLLLIGCGVLLWGGIVRLR